MAIPFVREIEFEYGKVEQVSPLIRRVIANNPGPFTYVGTGVYIIGHGEVAVLDPGPVDEAHFENLLLGISSASEGLDQELQPYLDRPVDQLDLMERIVLRIGAFELLNCPESPFRVVVDECVDLAHRFGSEQGHAYVNAVLDKAARAWRPGEADLSLKS